MAEPLAVSSVSEVLAAEPVIRRVVAARVANASDVDDLVQDCLERLLGARGRLAPETVLPFGIVTARNLVISHARTAARHARAAPRIVDLIEPARPDDMILAGEKRRAMATALSQLSPQERRAIVAYYDDSDTRTPAGESRESAGALRVRIARTRAKLRLEYLLAFRHVTLPTPLCGRVLLAISAGDTRRQRQLDAGGHLLDCETCAALSEPLEQRSVALTAITFPAALAAWALSGARAHPIVAAASAAGTAAVTAAALAGSGVLAPSPRPAHVRAARPASVSASAPPAAAPARPGPSPMMIRGLLVGGRPADTRSARGQAGQRAQAADVVVQQVVTRNGFWIGSSRARMWVQLTGPLRPLRIFAADRLQFHGTVVANGASYGARAGIRSRSEAGLLARQGAHIEVRTTDIRVHPPA